MIRDRAFPSMIYAGASNISHLFILNELLAFQSILLTAILKKATVSVWTIRHPPWSHNMHKTGDYYLTRVETQCLADDKYTSINRLLPRINHPANKSSD